MQKSFDLTLEVVLLMNSQLRTVDGKDKNRCSLQKKFPSPCQKNNEAALSKETLFDSKDYSESSQIVSRLVSIKALLNYSRKE